MAPRTLHRCSFLNRPAGLSAALTILLLAWAAQCQPLSQAAYPRQTPVQFWVQDSHGRPLRGVSGVVDRIVSCDYDSCMGKDPGVWSVSGKDGQLCTSVPFPGRFVMEFYNETTHAVMRQGVTIRRSNQRVTVLFP